MIEKNPPPSRPLPPNPPVSRSQARKKPSVPTTATTSTSSVSSFESTENRGQPLADVYIDVMPKMPTSVYVNGPPIGQVYPTGDRIPAGQNLGDAIALASQRAKESNATYAVLQGKDGLEITKLVALRPGSLSKDGIGVASFEPFTFRIDRGEDDENIKYLKAHATKPAPGTLAIVGENSAIDLTKQSLLQRWFSPGDYVSHKL